MRRFLGVAPTRPDDVLRFEDVPKVSGGLSRAPTANDDANAAYPGPYSSGSSWTRPDTGDVYHCRSAAAGAARWVKFDPADHSGYVAGRYYSPFGTSTPGNGGAFVATTTYFTLGTIKERITISQLGTRIATVLSSGNFQLAIYTLDPTTGAPRLLVANTISGSTTTSTTVNVALSQGNTQIEPGQYWFAFQIDNTTATTYSYQTTAGFHASVYGSATNVCLGTSEPIGLTMPGGTFGTWPSDYGVSPATPFGDLVTARAPVLQFLVASVP